MIPTGGSDSRRRRSVRARGEENPPIVGRWMAALALIIQATAGCSSRAASPRHQHVGELAPPATAPAMSATSTVPAVQPPRLDKSLLATRVKNAYHMRAAGQANEARAEFAKIVLVLIGAGEIPAPGLGAATGFAVPGRTTAGFTIEGGAEAGTLFFDLRTGEPFAFSPGVSLRPEGPAVDAPFFVTAPPSLHDPTTGYDAALGGALVAVHPEGHRAYVLDERCRMQEWNIAEARTTRALGAHRPALVAAGQVPEECATCACDAEGFRSTVVTVDGRWLVSQWGRWNLASGAFSRLPIPWTWDGHQPAVSPDGRYVAFIRENPKAPPDAMVGKHFLALYDMELRKSPAAPKALPTLSNGSPLSFGTTPLRVCVHDYGDRVFAVPSLAQLATWATGEKGDSYQAGRPRDPLLDCSPKAATPPPHPDLTARLAAHVCSFGGFLLPREHCEHAR